MSAQNRQKLTPFVCKMSALAQPPPPLFVRNTINFENPEFFCTKKCDVRIWRTLPSLLSEKCPHWKSLPPDCGRLVWTAPYKTTLNGYCAQCSHWFRFMSTSNRKAHDRATRSSESITPFPRSFLAKPLPCLYILLLSQLVINKQSYG